MTKLLAVIKREYVQRVRSRMFIVTTVLLPFAMALFGIAPALVLSIEAGKPQRIVVVDGTGKIYGRFQRSLNGSQDASSSGDLTSQPSIVETARQKKYRLEQFVANGQTEAEINAALENKLRAKEIDGYLILPANLMQDAKAKFIRRNTSDIFSTQRIQEALDSAVREQRLSDAHVDAKTMADLARSVNFETTKISAVNGERDASSGFILVFAVGFVMYISVLLYGQVVLGAVIEEKETRIAEILFSSVKPFTLMIGKLIGVFFVALTQLAIWGLAIGAFALYGVNLLASKGMPTKLPHVPIVFYVYFVLFFLAGYFVYSTLYALVGSMVTTSQEGGQLAMPIIILLVISFYLFLPVSQNPDSPTSFWLSMIPFFAPVSMLVRVVTQTPPLWQIALSLAITFASGAALTWVSGRIYRTGMLMYGKRPSIPELIRWVRQT